VADTSRIEELRRRVQRDPASIAFAQLAEEYRRAGRYKEAIETCEQGLAHHPGYLSARVTLGRSYLETNELESAQLELRQVLRAAPENLAALRGLAEIHHRRGELQEALAHYRTALEFARNDPELQHIVGQIAKELEPQPAAPSVVDGLSFEDVRNTFLNLSLPETTGAGEAADSAVPPEDTAASAALEATAETTAEEAFPWPAHEEPAAVGPEEPAVGVPQEPAAIVSEEPTAAVSEEPAVALSEEPPDAAPEMAADVVAGEPDHPAQLEPAPAAEPAMAEESAPAQAAAPVVPDSGSLEDLAAPAQGVDAAEAAMSEPAFDLPEDFAVVDESFTAAPAALPAEPARRDPQVDALERWLETIIADRQRRA